MTIYYSSSTGGFYDTDIHFEIPDDSVEIPDSEHEYLLRGQSGGKLITYDENGSPRLSEHPPLTDTQVIEQYQSAIQDYLDKTAKAAGYDDIKTAVTYAEEPIVPKFQNDGKAFRKWRSLVWKYAYEQLDLVVSEQRSMPTIEEFLLELPAPEPLV